MEAVLQKICSKLGPKWVLLVTKRHFLTPRRRYDIEGRYNADTMVTNRAVVFKNCALDCIREWMETEPLRRLDEEGKIKKLLYEIHKIEDFVPLVEEIAILEGIDLSDQSFLQDAEVSGSHEAGLCVGIESTTRSAMTEFSQPQELWSMPSNVTPLLSPAGHADPPSWSYGDEASERMEGVASAYPREEEMKVNLPKITLHGGTAEKTESLKSGGEDALWREGGVELRSSRKKDLSYGNGAGVATGSNGKRKVLVDRNRQTLMPSDGSVDNLSVGSASSIAESQESDTGAYDVSIRMGIRRHKFAILDVSQRLREPKWRDIGVRLDLDEVFLSKLTKECIEERYYLMLKEWVELSRGGATFSRLREVLVDLEEDIALLVLEARLNSRGRILIRAVHHDL